MPIWRQAITWTNVDFLLIAPLARNFSEISIVIQAFSFEKLDLKMLSAKCRPQCINLLISSDTQFDGFKQDYSNSRASIH